MRIPSDNLVASKFLLVSMDDEKLIEAVRCFPSLWQVNSRLYRDVIAKENALKEIANQVSECLAYAYEYYHYS